MADFEEDFLDEKPEAPEPDSYFLSAQKDIAQLYDSDRNRVHYIRQLQVKFEKKYFHWITDNALKGYHALGYLKTFTIKKRGGISTKYYFHRSNRYPKRNINEIQKIINEYSQSLISLGCGKRAENLFCVGLFKHGFKFVDSKVNKFMGKEWKKTGHDLDYIFEKDGIFYGCEVKNTLPYIDKNELEVKIKICNFLKIRPLFIMRFAPKSYIEVIRKEGVCYDI